MKLNFSLILFFAVICVKAQTISNCFPTGKFANLSVDSIKTDPFVPDSAMGNLGQTILTNPADRYCYWVHGFGGNETTWNRAATAVQSGAPGFSARKIESKRVVYDETIQDFNNARNVLDQNIGIFSDAKYPNGGDRTVDFVIAHSQGGLVARHLDRGYENPALGLLPRKFKGIVTFGTPHAGAQIVENISKTNVVDKFVNDACSVLAAGPLEEALHETVPEWFIRLFGIDKKAQDWKNLACSLIGSGVGAFAKIKVGALAQEYKPYSGFLEGTFTGLNGYFTPNPAVAFYGVEELEGICYKTLYSFTVEDANSTPYFQANSTDALAKQEAQNMMNKYVAKKDEWDHKSRIYISPYDFFRPEGTYPTTIYKLYLQGVNFLKDADSRWSDVTGARKQIWYKSYRLVSYCDCSVGTGTGGGGGGGGNTRVAETKDYNLQTKYDIPGSTFREENPGGEPGDCPGLCVKRWYSMSSWNSTIGIVDSDGIVLAESASKFPAVGGAFKVSMPSSNHNQMKNDQNTKDGLNNLFEGHYGNHFKTPPR